MIGNIRKLAEEIRKMRDDYVLARDVSQHCCG